jgi:hypothetical protein
LRGGRHRVADHDHAGLVLGDAKAHVTDELVVRERAWTSGSLR